MKPKETHNTNKEDSDSDDEDDMADIKSKKTTNKLHSKTSSRKEKSCRPDKKYEKRGK